MNTNIKPTFAKYNYVIPMILQEIDLPLGVTAKPFIVLYFLRAGSLSAAKLIRDEYLKEHHYTLKELPPFAKYSKDYKHLALYDGEPRKRLTIPINGIPQPVSITKDTHDFIVKELGLRYIDDPSWEFNK